VYYDEPIARERENPREIKELEPMLGIRVGRLAASVACCLVLLAPAARLCAQPEPASPPSRLAPPPTVEQILSDGGWRSLTWYLLTREDREEVFVRDVGLDARIAAALAEYGSRAAAEYEANRAALKAEYCPRLTGITTPRELEITMREWTPRGEQELTRLLDGAFKLLGDADARRLSSHLGQLSRTTLFMGSDFDVDYAKLTPAGVKRMVGSVCDPAA
jgi:hypothetical protein